MIKVAFNPKKYTEEIKAAYLKQMRSQLKDLDLKGYEII